MHQFGNHSCFAYLISSTDGVWGDWSPFWCFKHLWKWFIGLQLLYFAHSVQHYWKLQQYFFHFKRNFYSNYFIGFHSFYWSMSQNLDILVFWFSFFHEGFLTWYTLKIHRCSLQSVFRCEGWHVEKFH